MDPAELELLRELEADMKPAAAMKCGNGEEENEHKPSAAERLVRLALELFEIGRTTIDEPFAIPKRGPRIAMMFRGSRDALRATLAREFRRRENTTPGAGSLADALTALQGEALDAPPVEVHVRVAQHSGEIVVDLGRTDGKVVVVGSSGWEVRDSSPMIFRRTALSAELPIPERGNLNALHSLLNVDDDCWHLLIGWLVSAFMPNIPHPPLMLGGQHGAGKSTMARVIGSVIDPSTAPLRSQPRDAEAWAMAAAGSWLVAIDNVSRIPGWWSDALCRAVTGDGWIRRKLYTDSELAVLSFRRVVLLTSIDAGALRGDLGDRLLLADLEPIPPSKRLSEAELDWAVAAARPRILGALLTELAAVLKTLPEVESENLPRMADFARVLGALDKLHGTKRLNTYLMQRGRVVEDVLEADPVAAALRELVDWTGTSGELLQRITPEGPRPRDWPANPRALVARLKRLVPALGQVGTQVIFHNERTNRGREISIRKQPSQQAQQSPPERKVSDDRVTVVTVGDGPEILSTAVSQRKSDGCDGSDGRSVSFDDELGADETEDSEADV
jgi:hypothetical protein